MSDISAVIQKFVHITGRKVSDFDRERIQSIADALKIDADDAFLQLIVLLDMYWGIYEEYPAKIRYAIKGIEIEGAKQVGKVLLEINKQTEQSIDEITTTSRRETRKVQELAYKAEQNSWWLSLRAKIICFTASFITICILICCTAFVSYNAGKNVSYTLSQVKANNITAFLNTQLFRDVYYLYQDGTLDNLVHCRMDGWKIINGYCYAYPPGYGKVRFDVAVWSLNYGTEVR